jgi:hypothetical protein
MAAVGLVLLIGAVADVYGSPSSLFPALLIVIGIAMLADTLRGPPAAKNPDEDPRRERLPL